MSKHATKIAATLVLTVLFISGSPATSFGATGNPVDNDPNASYTLLQPLPCIPSPALKDSSGNDIPGSAVVCSGAQKTSINFQEYVQYAFNLLIALASVAAVFMIVWGGFQYMSSDSYNQKTDGLKKLQNAVSGLLLVLCSYLILRTVDPRLVKIPSTLVAPLNIEYKPDEVASFFKQLADDANEYRKDNMKIIDSVAKGQQLYNSRELEKAALCEKLASAAYGQETRPQSYTCADLVSQAKNFNSETEDLATQITKLEADQVKLKTEITTNQAIGIMNANIQKCYGTQNDSTRYWYIFDAGNGYTAADCLREISTNGAKYANMLRSQGQDVAANQVLEYQKYAESMSRINTAVLTNMSSSPDVRAFVDTLQSAVTTAATAAGAVYGDPIGAGIGFAGAQVFDGIAAGAITDKTDAAKQTISQIQLEINANKNLISDQKLQAQYLKQAHLLIQKLGGLGNDQDSTSYAPKPASSYVPYNGSTNFMPAPTPGK